MAVENLITEHLDIWTAAIKTKSAAGRGSSKKLELVGVKKLRELILELAVRGKLVPQDPNDEPASELLKKIEAEKARLVKEGKIKKPKKLPEINEDEEFGDLPLSWQYVRLNELGEWGAGSTPPRGDSTLYGGEIPWFKSGELNSDYISESEETVTELALKKSSLRFNKTGDVLLAMYGATIGKTSILLVPATTNQAVCACTPFNGFSNIYLLTLLKAYRPRFIGMGAGGAQPNISREKIIHTVIALPPHAEQHSIVAKVDELMVLCDQLEAQTEASIDAHKTLVEVLLATLTDAKDADELNDNWQTISQHFDVLFTTQASIDQLKQTILQLAVMGKLVKQDPNDEPASKLLERIATEKQQLIKDGKIKKQKPLPPITDEEKSFGLPMGWEWSKCLDIFMKITDGEHATPKRSDSGHYLLSARNVTNEGILLHDVDFVPTEEFVRIRKRCDPNIGDILISCSGSVGRVALVDRNDAYSMVRSAAMIRPDSDNLQKEYLALMLRSPYLQIQMKNRSKQSAQANLFLGAISNLVSIIPPLSEQHRIVTKVDELMALCDSLKANINQAQITQLQLTGTIVEQAL
jgi:type I restriction enzyme S subunit